MHLQNGINLSNVKREIKSIAHFSSSISRSFHSNSISSTLECFIVECELNGAMI